MSEIKKDKCDNCGKETRDRYLEVGWIALGHPSVSISLGREKSGPAVTGAHRCKDSDTLDFCCVQCMVSWMAALAGKTAAKRKLAIDCWGGLLRVSAEKGYTSTVADLGGTITMSAASGETHTLIAEGD